MRLRLVIKCADSVGDFLCTARPDPVTCTSISNCPGRNRILGQNNRCKDNDLNDALEFWKPNEKDRAEATNLFPQFEYRSE